MTTGYAVNFNKRHKRSGHLFQNSYKSIVVEEDPYFMELVRYSTGFQGCRVFSSPTKKYLPKYDF
ncbi:MAG TPA: hypothetical protein DDY22_02665 [Geobacter sp.]|nr:hypothetical protein [Geobacter sp.]